MCLQAYTDAHTTHTHTHKVYLLGIVLDTLLNSWLLAGAWGWLCVGGLQTSGPVCPPPSVSSILLVSALSSLIKQGTCSANNLPPQSPGTTPAFHQHHCFSLLPPLVLPHHGNTHTHIHMRLPPSLVSVPSVDRLAMCLFIRMPAATPLYVEST